jgi:hypothetical protein
MFHFGTDQSGNLPANGFPTARGDRPEIRYVIFHADFDGSFTTALVQETC